MKKIIVIIIIAIIVAILTFVIPVRKEEAEEIIWINQGPASYGHHVENYYNIYNIKIFSR